MASLPPPPPPPQAENGVSVDATASQRPSLDRDIAALLSSARDVTITSGEDDRLAALLTRSDGLTLLYEGRTNLLFGREGTAKSWLALVTALATIDRGGRVLWLDWESSPRTMARRARMLGPEAEATVADKDRLLWLSGEDVKRCQRGALKWLREGGGVGLVVIDAASSAGAPRDSGDIHQWFERTVRPWQRAELSVLLLDHVAKNASRDDLTPVGSGDKIARVDGSGLQVSGSPWTKTKAGRVFLTLAKDREGDLDSKRGKVMAVVDGRHSQGSDGRDVLRITFDPPEDTGEVAVDDLKDRIIEVLGAVGEIRTTGNLATEVGGRREDILKAAKALAEDGEITIAKDGRADIFTLAEDAETIEDVEVGHQSSLLDSAEMGREH